MCEYNYKEVYNFDSDLNKQVKENNKNRSMRKYATLNKSHKSTWRSRRVLKPNKLHRYENECINNRGVQRVNTDRKP